MPSPSAPSFSLSSRSLYSLSQVVASLQTPSGGVRTPLFSGNEMRPERRRLMTP